jgi:glutaminase
MTEGGLACHRLGVGDSPGDGICLITSDGESNAGRVDEPFTMMSVVKPFLLLYALETLGAEAVRNRIGQQPSDQPYWSVEQLAADGGRPRNAMINSGAMVLASLVEEEPFVAWLQAHVPGAAFALDAACLTACLHQRGQTVNRQLAAMLAASGAVADAESAYLHYFRICCLTASARDVARLAHRLLASRADEHATDVKHVMAMAGLYEESPEWIQRTGWPAKSGVSGILFAVHPERAIAVAACSPWVNERGTPVVPERAIEIVCGWF